MTKFFKLTKNKTFEIQVEKGFNNHFDFVFRIDTEGDHNGLHFNFNLWNFLYFSIQVFDNRHWNYEKDRFYTDYEEYEVRVDELDAGGLLNSLGSYKEV